MAVASETGAPGGERGKRIDGRRMRRALLAGGVAVGLLVVLLVANTFRARSRQLAVEPATGVAVDPQAPERLAAALRLRTISHQDPARIETAEFTALHRHLEESFPVVHRTLRRETVSDLSLLYTWPGRDRRRRPVVLLAHLDVVPVEPGTEGAWTEPPFGGRVSDGYVWGRGALDDKGAAVGILEAVETLLGEGFVPARTVLVAFGHDEEVGGGRGATAIAQLLQERGVSPECVLDEGPGVTVGIVPGVAAPVALVGIAEKGYLSLELAVESEGGHSALPPRETAIAILAAALVRLEREQMPTAIEGATRQLLDYLGPEMGFPTRVALANRWLFGGLVERRLAAVPETNALVRTTTAPTMLEGSIKDNVLPARPRAVVNFRIRPGDSVARVVEHVRATVADPRVAVGPYGAMRSEPSRPARVDSPAFATIQRTIGEIFPGAIVVPALVLGATDGRHYDALADDVYRFAPVRMRREDAPRIHGTNERVAVGEYREAVRFYAQWLRNYAGP